MISKYKIKCSCEHAWLWIDASAVDIRISLETKQRYYSAICPECGNPIINVVEDMTIG
jgi:Zn finger protein HypA/HybF involved in hydrogenase expression